MAFDIDTAPAATGDFLPPLKWNAQGGFATIKRSTRNPQGGWDKTEEDVALPLKIVIDFENAEQGWIRIMGGVDFKMAKLGLPKPERPSLEHALGFRVNVFGKQLGLAAFSHTAKSVIKEMNTLHDSYLAGVKQNAGKLPVVEIKGSKKVQSQTRDEMKTFRVPDWSIVAWVDRPAEMQKQEQQAAQQAAVELDDDVAF